jgi:predicted phosphodiesterase
MLTAREAVMAAFDGTKKPLTRKEIVERACANDQYEGTVSALDAIIYAKDNPVLKRVGRGVYSLDRDGIKEAARLKRIATDTRTEEDRLRDENASLRGDLKRAAKILQGFEERARVEDRLAQAIAEQLSTADLETRAVPPKAEARNSTAKGHEFLALLSDAHFGEVVNPEEALGLNYDTEVSRERIAYWRDTVIRYAQLRRASYPVDKLTVAVLGDMLSGDIHHELSITNEMLLSEQASEMAHILFNVAEDFVTEFPAVEFIVLPGNHPRTTKKPKHKTKYDNWEWIMGQMFAGMVDKAGLAAEVKVPKSLVHTHQIFDTRIGMWHGDGVKSASFAGIPFYGMRQQREAIQALMSQLGLSRIDMLVMGHFHQHLYWQGECDILINGSIKGGDEYGISTRLSAPDPIQVLLEFHPEHGLTAQEHITLKHIG